MQKAKSLIGKEIAQETLLALRVQVVEAEKKEKNAPGLAVIMVGDDPASALYVRNKKKACHKVGIAFHDYHFEKDEEEKNILDAIDFLNNDSLINGIIVQLPLPTGFDTAKIINAISPLKDVDGFHPENINKISEVIANKKRIAPAAMEKIQESVTPPVLKAILKLLDQIEEPLKEKKGFIVAKNEIFAGPLKEVVGLKEIDIEIISPDEKELARKLQKVDIIITAAGRPRFLKGDMIKEGAIVIDVGTTLVDGKTIGDADFLDCEKKAAYISPVPGGIGPLTVSYLLENVVKLWKNKN